MPKRDLVRRIDQRAATGTAGSGGSGAASGNADTVDGIHASRTPTANMLVPLDASALLPAAVLPPISVDALSDVAISGTPADNELLAWDTAAAGWINQTAAEAGVQPTLTVGNLTATSPIALDQTRQVIGGAAVVSLGTQTANYALAGPATGAAGAPTFRALVAADLPTGDMYPGYLLATGARTGASAQVQSFTNGVSSTLAGGAATASMSIISTEPIFRFSKTNGIADYQKFEIRQVSYTSSAFSYLQFRSANDANSVFATRLALFNTGMLFLGQGNPSVGATAYMMNIVEDTSTVGLMIRAAATTPLDALQVQNSATTVVQAIRADGTYYATPTSLSHGLSVALTTTNTSSVASMYSTITPNIVANSSASYSGLAFIATHNKQVTLTLNGTQPGQYASGGLMGMYGQIVIDGTAGAGVLVDTALGSAHQVILRNGGVVTNAIGVSIQPAIADVGAGTVTNAFGILIKTPYGNSLTLTNAYGVYLQDQNKGGTLNYALYTNAGLNRLGDQLSVVGSEDRVQFQVTKNATQTTDLARIGDGTNYTRIAADGTLTLVGTATAWEDLRIEPVVRGGGANNPDFEQFADDTALGDTGTSRGVYLYMFDDAATNSEREAWFTMQMPHAWAATAIYMHVHWAGTHADTTAAPIWGLEYVWKEIGATYAGTATVYTDGKNYNGTTDDADIVAGKHYLSKFAAITPDATQDGLSSILLCRLFRRSGAASDTYNVSGNKCGLLYVDAHYEVDSFGSSAEYVK